MTAGLPYLVSNSGFFQGISRVNDYLVLICTAAEPFPIDVRMFVCVDSYRRNGYFYGKTWRGFKKALREWGLQVPSKRLFRLLTK